MLSKRFGHSEKENLTTVLLKVAGYIVSENTLRGSVTNAKILVMRDNKKDSVLTVNLAEL